MKPVDADNSLGVSLVRDADELPAALAAAREHSEEVLVEDYVELGREVRCGLLEADGELVPLPLEEYGVDADRPIRRAADKIRRDGGGGLALVAKGEPHARIVPRDDPVDPAGLGGGEALPRGARLPPLQPLRLPHRPRRAALVPRGRALLLLRPPERDRDDGGRRRHPARRPLRGRRARGIDAARMAGGKMSGSRIADRRIGRDRS